MKTKLLFDFIVIKESNTIIEKREFAASLELIWEAWTNPQIIDRWRAPKSMRTQTKTMDFREGGYWHFSITGRNGEKHWSRYDYQKIEPQKSITELRAFSDEKGSVGTDTPLTRCTTVFSETNGKTLVTATSHFGSREIFEFMASGHREGLASCYENLDKLVATLEKGRNDKLDPI